MDLFGAFISFNESGKVIKILENIFLECDSTIAVLALEGLFRMEESIERSQIDISTNLKDSLNVWISSFPTDGQDAIKHFNIFCRFFEKPVPPTSTPAMPLPQTATSTPEILEAIRSDQALSELLTQLIPKLQSVDSAVAVLALEGLYRWIGEVRSALSINVVLMPPNPTHIPELPDVNVTVLKTILRQWRCEYPPSIAYNGFWSLLASSTVLRQLTIFKILGVPLFIDDYGRKDCMSLYNKTRKIDYINELTPIGHVTHAECADLIMEKKRIVPSNKKNSLEGCWFGIHQEQIKQSVYGSKCFKTTLGVLGVTGLRQGEIVSYKNEVNVILYADDAHDSSFSSCRQPTIDAAIMKHGMNAYVSVSIFVPSRFLPNCDRFLEVFCPPPIEVLHTPFCVKEKREKINCGELRFLGPTPFPPLA